MSYKVFLNISEKIRLERRLKRDLLHRARTLKSINKQYKKSVIPMHIEFVQPLKKHADLTIEHKNYNSSKNILFKKIERILND